MRRASWFLALAWAATGGWLPAAGQGTGGLLADPFDAGGALKATDKFSVRLVPSHATVAPGTDLHVAVEMTVAEGFWTYGPVAGGRLVAAQDLTIEPGASPLRTAAVLYGPTTEHVTELGGGETDTHNVYEGRAYAYVPVTVRADLEVGTYELPLTVAGQVCDPNVCLQLSTTATAEIEVAGRSVVSDAWVKGPGPHRAEARTAAAWRAATGGPAKRPSTTAPAGAGAPAEEFQVLGGSWVEGLGVAGGLVLALLGGALLNVLPCVLPILPLRLMALVEQAQDSRGRSAALGAAFAGGILLFFVCVAVLSVVLKLAVGYDVTLNDLFRHPPLLIGMTLVLVVLAMSLFNVFSLTVPGKVAEASGGGGYPGAIGTGFLFAVLSTPCSAAIIGALFWWAQLQPLWVGAVSLVLMGVGMGAPHAALTAFPPLIRRIPRAGRWSELLKQFVGFVLLLIAVWLLSTQMADAYLGWVAAYAVVLAMCLWVWGSWVTLSTPTPRTWAVRGAAVVAAAAAGVWMLRPPAPPKLEMAPFDADRIARARADGRTVVVKFTAGWCVECLVVDRKVYADDEVVRALTSRDVLAMKGDVTKDSYPASEMLYRRLGQSGPPMTAVFPPGKAPPILLRGLFDKADLLEALRRAKRAGEEG